MVLNEMEQKIVDNEIKLILECVKRYQNSLERHQKIPELLGSNYTQYNLHIQQEVISRGFKVIPRGAGNRFTIELDDFAMNYDKNESTTSESGEK